MPIPSPVTVEQSERLLTLYTQGESLAAVAREVGYCPATIKKHLRRAGIAIRPQRLVTEMEKDQMITLYKEGKNTYEVGRLLNRPGGTVVKTLRKVGVKTRDSSHCGKRLSVKEDYFASIDTPTKAYLLGVIYADGNVYHNRFKLAMWAIDEPFLLAVARELGFDGTLYREKKRGPKRQDMLSLVVYSSVFVNHLRDKGVIDNKTNRLTFPTWLREDLKVHFVHGLLDGDGCICITRELASRRIARDWRFCTSFAGCYVVMEGLSQWLDTQGVHGSLRHNDLNPLSGRLSFSGAKALKVANVIYRSAQSLCLSRKRETYRRMVYIFDETRAKRQIATQQATDEALRILALALS